MRLCYDDAMTTFREQMLIARPEIAERERAHPEKGRQAMELRRMRDAAELSQEQVAATAGVEIAEVRRLESLVGALPTSDEVSQYRAACGVP